MEALPKLTYFAAANFLVISFAGLFAAMAFWPDNCESSFYVDAPRGHC